MGFWPAAEPQVGALPVEFDTDNHATRTIVMWIRLREVLLYRYPEVSVTEKSELITILIFVKWSDRVRNGLV
jgi:hypothetical protein